MAEIVRYTATELEELERELLTRVAECMDDYAVRVELERIRFLLGKDQYEQND